MLAPRHPHGDPDRHIECQEALEDRVLAIIDEGWSAGWSTAEMTVALVAIADNIMFADAANRQTDRDIEDALKRLGL